VAAISLVALTAAVISVVHGCASPPSEPDDACAIFREKRRWYDAAVRSRERWGVPESVQLAIIYQESSFRAHARPPRRRILWIFPGPRPSSAYGYGQVVNETWEIYKRDAGRPGAERDDFDDAADFIGWYAARSQLRTGVRRDDAYGLYLVYHEGPGGYLRRTHQAKRWLIGTAKQVSLRATRYERQLSGCRESLNRPWWRIL
jgi:hypothetical protein